jgi:hypothetical protein
VVDAPAQEKLPLRPGNLIRRRPKAVKAINQAARTGGELTRFDHRPAGVDRLVPPPPPRAMLILAPPRNPGVRSLEHLADPLATLDLVAELGRLARRRDP